MSLLVTALFCFTVLAYLFASVVFAAKIAGRPIAARTERLGFATAPQVGVGVGLGDARLGELLVDGLFEVPLEVNLVDLAGPVDGPVVERTVWREWPGRRGPHRRPTWSG